MHYVISYDMPNDRRRVKMAKILLDFGNRVQYSVFEASLDKKLFDKLLKRVNSVVDEQEDNVRIYPLCAICENGIINIGKGDVLEDKDVYIL